MVVLILSLNLRTKMLKIKEITPEIYHLKFKDQDAMGLHLLRFSSYYESKNIKLYRSIFSLEDALQYGYKNNKDEFEWADGINLPISIIYKMAKEYGSLLSIQEKFILSLIDNIKREQPALKYFIATYGQDDEADELYHELAHAFYYTDEAYKIKSNALIKILPEKVQKEMYTYLSRLDYHESVHDDEFQAYMATGLLGEEKEVVNENLINMFRAKFFDLFLTTLSENDI